MNLHKLWFNANFYLVESVLKIIYEITSSSEVSVPIRENSKENLNEMCSSS